MDEFESLSHSKWECKYHIVFIPKRRRKRLYGQLKKHLGEVFHRLAQQKESQILEGHVMADHMHMLMSIPPKYAVSQVVGFIKGEERDPLGAGVCREEEKLRGATFLGPRLLCVDGRTRRGSDSRVHQASRGRRHAIRPNETVELSWPPIGGPKSSGPR